MPWELEVCLFVENQDLGPRAVVAPSAGSAYVLSFLPPFLESKKCVTREKQGRQPVLKYHASCRGCGAGLESAHCDLCL